MTGFIFSVREIRENSGLTTTLELPAEKVFPEPRLGEAALSGPVRVDVEFSVGGNRILAQARARGRWALPCSRCLEESASAFEGSLEETYPTTGDSIDLTEDLRQTLLLEIPQRALCRPDCRGLCARCGKNLNQGPCGCADPRRENA